MLVTELAVCRSCCCWEVSWKTVNILGKRKNENRRSLAKLRKPFETEYPWSDDLYADTLLDMQNAEMPDT